MPKLYAVQDNTYVAPDSYKEKQNDFDYVSGKYGELHDTIKNKFRKYVPIQPLVDEASDYYNNELYKEHPILAALGASATDDLYPMTEDIVTDPINIALTTAVPASKAVQIAKDWKSTPQGWENATRLDDYLHGRFKTVLTPNYSRRGSAGDVIYRAGEDGNRYSIGGRDFSMVPVSYSNSELAKSVTGGPSVGNGNHRMMSDRMLGSKTLAQDNDYFATRLKDKKLMLSNKKYNPTGDPNPDFWLNTDAMKLDKWNENSGMRNIRIKGIKETDYMTDKQIGKLAKDRAKKALRYNIANPSLEDQLFRMSDNYSYNVPWENYPREQFVGHFLTESGDDAYNGINPFRDMNTYKLAGIKSTNPWHTYLQGKIDDGTIDAIMTDMAGGVKQPHSFLDNQYVAQEVLRRLEPVLQKDYQVYIAKNNLKVRPSLSW